ncbi:MAG: hypothetical protein JJT94_09405 [Bernardetiaceae bacterium]|nr:hypothetical protein [Bernardetiaceae bacterium]
MKLAVYLVVFIAILLLAGFFVFVINFNKPSLLHAQNNTMTSMSLKQPTTSYQYTDGSNNYYDISANMIRYKPVSSTKSSSGTYSGGQAWHNESIEKDDYKKLEILLEHAFENKDAQIKHRNMGCGTLSKINAQTAIKETIFLDMNSNEKLNLEAQLKKIQEKSITCRLIYPLDIANRSKRPISDEQQPDIKYVLIQTCPPQNDKPTQRQVLFLVFDGREHTRQVIDIEQIFENYEEAYEYAKTHKIAIEQPNNQGIIIPRL